MRELKPNERFVIVKFDHTEGPAVGEADGIDEDGDPINAPDDWETVYQEWLLMVEGEDVAVEDSIFTASVELAGDE